MLALLAEHDVFFEVVSQLDPRDRASLACAFSAARDAARRNWGLYHSCGRDELTLPVSSPNDVHRLLAWMSGVAAAFDDDVDGALRRLLQTTGRRLDIARLEVEVGMHFPLPTVDTIHFAQHSEELNNEPARVMQLLFRGLSHVMPGLRHVSFQMPSYETQRLVPMLAPFRSLESLELDLFTSEDDVYEVDLSDVHLLSSLRSLDIFFTADAEAHVDMDSLPPHLTLLSLQSSRHDAYIRADDLAKCLSTATGLRTLRLVSNVDLPYVPGSSIGHLTSLLYHGITNNLCDLPTSLRELKLKFGDMLNFSGYVALGSEPTPEVHEQATYALNLTHLTGLEALSLELVYAEEGSPLDPAHLRALTGLTSLHLHDVGEIDVGVFAAFSRLSALSLDVIPLPDRSPIPVLPPSVRLERLHVSFDAYIKDYEVSPHGPELKLGPQGHWDLFALPQLRHMSLRSACIPDAKSFEHLRSLTHLRSLHLAKCTLGAASVLLAGWDVVTISDD